MPKVQIPPPPNINNVLSSLTPGYPINVLEFDNSRKVLGPDNINLQYITINNSNNNNKNNNHNIKPIHQLQQ